MGAVIGGYLGEYPHAVWTLHLQLGNCYELWNQLAWWRAESILNVDGD
jgi:hypothetical protein